MLFSSLTFLFYFLPAVLILYFILPGRFKNTVLFIFSLIFYAWGEPTYIFIMLLSTGICYAGGLAMGKYHENPKRKIAMTVSVCLSLSMLILFKYTNFFIGAVNGIFKTDIGFYNLSLPIGISFYTFKLISYLADVYRGEVCPQKNFISFGTYVALFPQLMAGPIVRYSNIADALEKRTHSAVKAARGARRFIAGLCKKVLIANNIGMLWDTISNAGEISTLASWLGITAFTLQIYFDFSGYSDMAIGLCSIFGFDVEENFNYPYISRSVTEFWRRWHISLGTWFREYVYIPLGGSRCSTIKTFRNIFIVWVLTGLWHGAGFNFIAWGLFYCVLLIIEKLFLGEVLKKLPKYVSYIYTGLAVIIGWVLFSSQSLSDALAYLKIMFGFGGGEFCDSLFLYNIKSYFAVIAAGVLGALPYTKKIYDRLTFGRAYAITQLISIAGLLLSVAYLADSSYNPFLYFRF